MSRPKHRHARNGVNAHCISLTHRNCTQFKKSGAPSLQIIFDDLAALHDKFDPLKLGNIL